MPVTRFTITADGLSSPTANSIRIESKRLRAVNATLLDNSISGGTVYTRIYLCQEKADIEHAVALLCSGQHRDIDGISWTGDLEISANMSILAIARATSTVPVAISVHTEV